ncbi:Sec-independent protein translocase protein TatB [Trinickia fusca]|uniref:Sec-independent protein translocase protein TatB n=1 Tax=Trinickia fusca TaxID=2419777 RepID=A0A494X314_9BURK|nr:Sec-independent protein translocase protein TatB [Trinickia fusca]RKP44001.1 Sec-independent protein translocase subunit TatB [Trinickia fusca]
MLDLGLTKMALIGVVALVVLGPERLPRVARTAGALFGRAQRYINEVKAEVTREIEIDELRRMKTEFESAARNVGTTIHDTVRQHEAELSEAWGSGMPSIAGSAAAGDEPLATTGDAGQAPSSWRSSMIASKKRRSWRVKRSATPVWYKRTTGLRTHVQSGAARVARYTPASLRTPRRFF